MDLWAEYFLIGTFIHLLSDAANIELAVSTDHLLYCLIPAAFHFLLLRSDNRGITPKWDNNFGNSATADSTANNKPAFICLSQYIMQLQWNPVLWTTLKSGFLRYCRRFVWSQMHLHMFVYSQNVEIPVFHKVDSSSSPNST